MPTLELREEHLSRVGEVGEQPRQIPEGVKAEAAGSADPDDNQVNMMLTLIIPH